MKRGRSSLYPASNPPGSHILVRIPSIEVSVWDRVAVVTTSMLIVGSAMWVPAFYAWAWKRFQSIPKEQAKRRLLYISGLLAATALFACGPHRNPRVARFIKLKKWSLWKSWINFFAMEVVADNASFLPAFENLRTQQAIVAFAPHGLFPFALAIPAVSELGKFAVFCKHGIFCCQQLVRLPQHAVALIIGPLLLGRSKTFWGISACRGFCYGRLPLCTRHSIMAKGSVRLPHRSMPSTLACSR